jgi:hypothetical protein
MGRCIEKSTSKISALRHLGNPMNGCHPRDGSPEGPRWNPELGPSGRPLRGAPPRAHPGRQYICSYPVRGARARGRSRKPRRGGGDSPTLIRPGGIPAAGSTSRSSTTGIWTSRTVARRQAPFTAYCGFRAPAPTSGNPGAAGEPRWQEGGSTIDLVQQFWSPEPAFHDLGRKLDEVVRNAKARLGWGKWPGSSIHIGVVAVVPGRDDDPGPLRGRRSRGRATGTAPPEARWSRR